MKKCSRVKNPCKICLQTVTNKTGVQCKGACKKWVHYTCLNFTPGKIKDIKAGIITITCPCPNCNTRGEPKEYLTDPPFTCNNQECPANKLPQCQINECPLNNPNPVMSRGVSPHTTQMGPLPCGPACSAFKSSHFTPPTSSPEMTRIPQVSSYQPTTETERPPCVSSPNEVPPCLFQPLGAQIGSPPRTPQMASSPLRASRTTSQKDVYSESRPEPPQLKSQSCSCMSGVPGDMNMEGMVDVGNQRSMESNGRLLKTGDCKASCSDSELPHNNNKENQKVLLCTIHQLCSTVGHLSTQIKDLMCNMMTDLNKDR